MLWNFSQFGKAGLANGLGAVLYLGGDLRRNGDEPVYSGVDFDTFRITTPYTHLDTEGDARLVAVAKDRMLQHPLATGALFIRKGARYLLGSFHGYFWPYNGLVGKLEHDPSWRSKCSTLVWLSLQVFVACGAFFSLFRRDLSVPVRGVCRLHNWILHGAAHRDLPDTPHGVSSLSLPACVDSSWGLHEGRWS